MKYNELVSKITDSYKDLHHYVAMTMVEPFKVEDAAVGIAHIREEILNSAIEYIGHDAKLYTLTLKEVSDTDYDKYTYIVDQYNVETYMKYYLGEPLKGIPNASASSTLDIKSYDCSNNIKRYYTEFENGIKILYFSYSVGHNTFAGTIFDEKDVEAIIDPIRGALWLNSDTTGFHTFCQVRKAIKTCNQILRDEVHIDALLEQELRQLLGSPEILKAGLATKSTEDFDSLRYTVEKDRFVTTFSHLKANTELEIMKTIEIFDYGYPIAWEGCVDDVNKLLDCTVDDIKTQLGLRPYMCYQGKNGKDYAHSVFLDKGTICEFVRCEDDSSEGYKVYLNVKDYDYAFAFCCGEESYPDITFNDLQVSVIG